VNGPTLNQLLKELKTLTGTDIEAQLFTSQRPAMCATGLADITRALEIFLGFQPRVGLHEGLQLTIDWWKQSRSEAQ